MELHFEQLKDSFVIDKVLFVLEEAPGQSLYAYDWLKKAREQGVSSKDFILAVKMLETVCIIQSNATYQDYRLIKNKSQ